VLHDGSILVLYRLRVPWYLSAVGTAWLVDREAEPFNRSGVTLKREDKAVTNSRMILISLLLHALMLAGCTTSGIDPTAHGQLLTIDMNAPNELSDEESGVVLVEIANRGSSDIGAVEATLLLPPELSVVSVRNDPRGSLQSSATAPNEFRYRIRTLARGETIQLRFEVRPELSTQRQTGAIELTAWQEMRPDHRLTETRRIRLRG
jgi:hypothetical protein